MPRGLEQLSEPHDWWAVQRVCVLPCRCRALPACLLAGHAQMVVAEAAACVLPGSTFTMTYIDCAVARSSTIQPVSPESTIYQHHTFTHMPCICCTCLPLQVVLPLQAHALWQLAAPVRRYVSAMHDVRFYLRSKGLFRERLAGTQVGCAAAGAAAVVVAFFASAVSLPWSGAGVKVGAGAPTAAVATACIWL